MRFSHMSIAIIVLAMIPLVSADTMLYTSVKTNGNVTVWTDVNTSGNVYTIINGVNMTNVPEYIKAHEKVWSERMTINDIMWYFHTGVNYFLGINQYAPNQIKQILIDLSKIFFTRREAVNSLNFLYNKIIEQQREIEALQYAVNQINSTAYCQGKISVMLKYNLTNVTCGKSVYIRVDPQIYGTNVIKITPGG